MAITPPEPARTVSPSPEPKPQPTAAIAAPTAAPPAGQQPPRPKGELDRRVLTTAPTISVVLRNGQTWKSVRLVEMDTWSLLLETEQGRVLLPKHAVDAYLLESGKGT